MFRKPATGVVFADDSIERAFNYLPENNIIKGAIRRAISNLKEDIFCGKNIPKKQIPREYIKKYDIDNAWWYPLPDGWRLIYSVSTPDNIEILAVILDYLDHKKYERMFKY
jgi:hypothetical protein